MRTYAILLLCAAAAHAAVVKRDVSVLPAESVKFIDVTSTKDQDENKNTPSEHDPIRQPIPIDQFGNDLRSAAGEVHIPVAIVEEPQPALKTPAENEFDNEVKPLKAEETVRDEEADAATPKPTFIQQTIQNVQAAQQAASLAIQQVLRPQQNGQASSSTTGTTGGSVLQQYYDNINSTFTNGINAIQQTMSDFINRNPNAQSDEASPGLIATLQSNVQSGVSQLYNTFLNVVNPTQGAKPQTTAELEKNVALIEESFKKLNQEFQIGLKKAAESLKQAAPVQQTDVVQQAPVPVRADSSPSPTPVTEKPSSGTSAAPTNGFFFFLNNIQSSWQQIVQNLQNGQTQNTQSDSTSQTQWNPIQQINNLQNFWSQFNIFGSQATTAKPAIRSKQAEVVQESSRKKGHGHGGGSGDNNDVSGDRVEQLKTSEVPEKVEETPEAIPEKIIETPKPAETEKSS